MRILWGLMLLMGQPTLRVASFHSLTKGITHLRSAHGLKAAEAVTTSDSVQRMKEALEALRKEREQQKLKLLATEVAITKCQKQLDNAILENALPSTPKEVTENGHSVTLTSSTSTDPKVTYDCYGFESRSNGSKRAQYKQGPLDSSVPPNALVLAADNFWRELAFLVSSFIFSNNEADRKASGDIPQDIIAARAENREKIKKLQLSNKAIWEREEKREQVRAPLVIKAPYYILCLLLDFLFDGSPIARFYFLETVARMPYFSYITMLHTYETLGWWRRSTEAKRVHFAEEYNEYHHLRKSNQVLL